MKLSAKYITVGLKTLLFSPAYTALVLLFFVFILLLLLWLFNLPLLNYVANDAGLSFGQQLLFGVESFTNVFRFFNNRVPILLSLVALTQGTAFAAYFYLRKINTTTAKYPKKGVGSLVFALIGSGCVACGGSIIYPLLALFSSTAAGSLSLLLGETLNLAALVLAVYALSGITNQIGYIELIRKANT